MSIAILEEMKENDGRNGAVYSHFIRAVEKHVIASPSQHFTLAVDTSRPARISTYFGKNSITMFKTFHSRKFFIN